MRESLFIASFVSVFVGALIYINIFAFKNKNDELNYRVNECDAIFSIDINFRDKAIKIDESEYYFYPMFMGEATSTFYHRSNITNLSIQCGEEVLPRSVELYKQLLNK